MRREKGGFPAACSIAMEARSIAGKSLEYNLGTLSHFHLKGFTSQTAGSHVIAIR